MQAEYAQLYNFAINFLVASCGQGWYLNEIYNDSSLNLLDVIRNAHSVYSLVYVI